MKKSAKKKRGAKKGIPNLANRVKPRERRDRLVAIRISEDDYAKFDRACGSIYPATVIWEWMTGKRKKGRRTRKAS